jgi:hypothetical protein
MNMDYALIAFKLTKKVDIQLTTSLQKYILLSEQWFTGKELCDENH